MAKIAITTDLTKRQIFAEWDGETSLIDRAKAVAFLMYGVAVEATGGFERTLECLVQEAMRMRITDTYQKRANDSDSEDISNDYENGS